MLLDFNTIPTANSFFIVRLPNTQNQQQASRRRLLDCQLKPTTLHTAQFLHPIQAKSKNDDASDSSFQLLDILLAPTPGNISGSPLPLFIPVVGLAYGIIDPYAAATTGLLFALLRMVATRLILFPELPVDDSDHDDEEEELRLRNERLRVDLFCVGISSGTALIVGEDFYPILIGAAIIAGVLLKTSLEEVVEDEQLTDDDKLMNRWDKRFFNQNDNNDAPN